MRKIITIALGLVMALGTEAQVVTIQDNQTGKALALATLYSSQPRAFTTTNARGEADITPFAGAEQIVIRMLGYSTRIQSYDQLKQEPLIQMEPSAVQMDELVVSAVKWSQSVNDIPTKVASLSAKTARLQNPQTAADLLGSSGKVFIQKSQQGGGSPMIRGFATNRLLYTVDGVRMNTAIFRSGNLQNVISLDPFAIQNTEVVFGPGSVIYGSDAIGGVMSFQTLKPQFSVSDQHLIAGSAVARYASANKEFTSHFDINVGGKKWAMLTSISQNDYGDLKMGRHGPDEYLRPFYVQRIDGVDRIVENEDPLIQRPTGYSQMNLMQKFRYQPVKEWDLEYELHYSETSAYDRYDRHIRYRNGLPRYGEWAYGPQIWMMNLFSLDYVKETRAFDQISLKLAQQFFEESRISRDMNKPNREVRTEQVHAWSANLDFARQFSARHHLYYGAEYVFNDVISNGVNEDISAQTSADGPARYPRASWVSYGIYLTDHYRLNERLSLSGGIRYGRAGMDAVFDTRFYPFPFEVASLNNGALTGSAGLVYHPTQEWAISTNLATAFRAPNVDDMGKVFDSEPGAVVVPNPDLQPEYAYNADLGVTRIFGDRMKIDLALYYTLLDQALVRRDFTMNGQDSILYDGFMSRVQAVQNAAVARVGGIQAGLELKLGGGLSLSSDINFQKGTEEMDDGSVSPSRHAPPWFGVTRLMYTDKSLTMQLYAMYSGEKSFDQMPVEEIGKDYMYATDADGNPYSPGWYTLNYKAMYQLTEALTVSAGVENLLDRRYRPYSSGIVAPGRNFILSLRMTY